MALRLEVTTETQARNTQPFLALGTAGLASRAMAGWEPAPREALCQSVCLSACSSGVQHPSAWTWCHPHGCHTCCHDGQG